jgi:hypothetical protein
MRNNGFWPDFDNFSPATKSSSQAPSFKPKQSDFSCSIAINSLSLLCYYNKDPIYLLNLEKIRIFIYDYKIYTLIKLISKNPTLHDISKNRGNHAELLKPLCNDSNEKTDFDENEKGSLDCEIKIFDSNFAAINKFKTYVGLRLGGLRVVFLKRIVNELVEYARFHVLKSFYGEEVAGDAQTGSSCNFYYFFIFYFFRFLYILFKIFIFTYKHIFIHYLILINKICLYFIYDVLFFLPSYFQFFILVVIFLKFIKNNTKLLIYFFNFVLFWLFRYFI